MYNKQKISNKWVGPGVYENKTIAYVDQTYSVFQAKAHALEI